ncbi:MAG: ParB/RepB/Spo0J family partition protein [Sterolibacterium sp.]
MLVARAPLAHFGASLTNRKHRTEHINNLAVSIKNHEVIQPITARPWPVSRPQPDGILYEIVVGEGRWLGSIEAGKEDIPFFWRDLSDKEAVELQLIENLQRDDISPLEEAQGYRRLIDDHGHTADTIAAEVGKSRSAIYNSLKLLDLCPAALKIARDHNLDASLMMLAARIPDEKLQIAAVKDMAPHYAGDEAMSYRRARDLMQRQYMLKLAEAPFSRADAELLPAAGSCQACPKRTGNSADLFADVTSTDMCTDPGCFDAKKTAHVAKQRALAKANNIKIIDGAEAKKIKPNSYNDDLAGGYIDLDKKMYSDSKNRTVRQILGKDAPAAEALLIDPHTKGKVIEVVSTATIKEKLAAKGAAVPTEVTRRGKSDAEKEAERKRKQEGIYRQRLFDSTRGAIAVSFDTREEDSVLDLREFRQVTDLLYHGLQFEDQKRLARLWIGPTEKTDDHELVRQLKKHIEAMERKDCARLMLEATLVGEIVPGYGSHTPENLLATAEALEIDAGAIKKGVISEMREKAKAKTKPATKAKATPKVQPETALPADEPLKIGDRVRVNDSVKAPLGSANIGKEGKVTSLIGKAFMVTFPNKGMSTSYDRSELDKLLTASPLQVGDSVRVKDGVKGPTGHLRKCCGREGAIEEISEDDDAYYIVRFGPKAHEIVTNLRRHELDKLSAKPVSTPVNAARATDLFETAAPANAKTETPKKATPKKPKVKSNPAPASPANEAAAPLKPPTLNPVQAWPFPMGART